jgi:DNA-directed RNA polymerase subunit M/transcription elongation factor TFIIS
MSSKVCKSCKNMLILAAVNGSVVFNCPSCGDQYKSVLEDNIVYADDNKTIDMIKAGETIFYYPSNPKIKKTCPKCKSELMAWVKDHNGQKIIGCGCGFSQKVIKT